jgi:hypothetical protein
MRRPAHILLSVLIAIFFLAGCQTAQYKMLEKIGIHKRDIMVDRVEKARDSQEEAKEQFKSALEEFSSVLKVQLCPELQGRRP